MAENQGGSSTPPAPASSAPRPAPANTQAAPERDEQVGGVTEAGREAAADPDVRTVGEAFADNAGASKDAIQKELDIARERAEERQADAEERIAAQASATAAYRESFLGSEQADVHRQNQEAERIMRLPTPQALEELGSVVGDPRKGPSS